MDFLKNNKRFSFKLDGVNIWETEYASEVKVKDDEVTTVYYFKDGIKVTNIAKKYDAFDAYEWVNYIENTSDAPTGIISELWDCDCTFPMEFEDVRRWTSVQPNKEKTTKIFAPTGSFCAKKEFDSDADYIEGNIRKNHFFAGETRNFAPIGGRSSDTYAPFFNIHKNGMGYILAVGWSGQWNVELKRDYESLTLRSKVEDTNFRLMPYEKFRTSSVVIMAYEADVAESQNKWRRLVKKHFSIIGDKNRAEYGPLCTNVWGGLKSEIVMDKIDVIKKYKLPFDYLWMDAGWYGVNTKPTPDEWEGDWPQQVGDWRVSPHIHPNGLKDVSDAIHEAGMKFLLWIEPERARITAPIVKEHPEYFLTDIDDKNENLLLNLGEPDAWEYCFKTVAGLIEELKIECFREDFNFSPLPFWRKNDAEDRCGITEIKFVNGFYKFWDALLEKFPNLIIDNCASGGRRIDIETMRRSIPLWRSDLQCAAYYDIDATQYHHLTFNTWMPYSGTAPGRGNDEYRMRSAYDAAAIGTVKFAASEEGDVEERAVFLKKYMAEYLMLRPYFSEDFYALTEPCDKTDTWCAAQFNRPEQSDGIVQVFRRENAPYETAIFALRGLDKERKYRFTDLDGGEFVFDGNELLNEGFKVTVSEKRKAKIYMYKAI